ncbi:11S globulin seed storage protein 1 [Lactuca sativa]|uniref:Cupin type-1 domain-containing protein n=1 Tax=Lactuca sativa TaxID=4236 RepID=A0A9R1VH23_LACSA|nr:11S globulin seed storage protein 1 [Lactuca sativa]KAJ0206060.1 hypothetical protein LSAT_V11C500252690 [Lactuca sativa]
MSFRLLSLGLCFLVLFHGGLAQIQPPRKQQTRLSGLSECQIDRITAREPNRVVESEAGVSEFWIPEENDELECAGVEAVRHTINPKGLLLPYYPSAPELAYVVRGEGIQGTVLPGCPETFETSFPSEGGKGEFFDKHQKVYRYKEGDILALPAGVVHWTYNDGDRPIVTIVLRDTSNVANQLDRTFRKFFLAGNSQSQQGQQGGRGQQQRGQETRWEVPSEGRAQGGKRRDEPHRAEGGRRRGQQEQEGSNIFNGFDDQILQDVFNVDYETVRQLKGQNDNRGFIVQADNFRVITPEKQEQGRERQRSSPSRGKSGRRGGGGANGFDETLCSAQLSANLANPTHADVYNPRGGRVSSLNSHKFPVLDLLQLSAERGILYKNAIHAPYYNLNAHSVIYVTSGSSRLQIVKNDGSAVFDDWVREGQLIVVPQNFAVVKKAGEEGCEWVAFKTNDNAITSQLAGRFSFVRALPEEVLVNSYEISREQAKSLKYNRQEAVVLSPRSTSPRETAKNALLNVLFG